MFSRRCQRDVTPPRSLEPIQGISLQGCFNPFDIFIECFYSQDARNHFYAHFQSCCIEVKHSIDLRDFQDTIFLPFLEREGENYCLPYKVLIILFYVNMHTISLSHSFWVIMFGQSFHITSLLVRRVLDMPRFDTCLPFFPLEIQSFILGKLFFYFCFIIWCSLGSSYLYSFSWLLQAILVLATFVTYSFYLSSHHTKIRRSTACFICTILSG